MSEPLAVETLAAELKVALAHAQAHRLNLKITRTNEKFAVTTTAPSKRLRASPTLLEALEAEKSLRQGSPLPKNVVWDATALAELLLQMAALNGRIFFEADFRKTGQGKVFSVLWIVQGNGVQVSLDRLRGNNAAAVLGQALHETQFSPHLQPGSANG